MTQDQSKFANETTQQETSEAQAQDQVQSQDEQSVVEINGEQVSLDELKQGYMRQSDYTRKTQEIAELRRTMAREPRQEEGAKVSIPDDQELQQAVQLLKQQGFATKEDLEILKAQQSDQAELSQLLDANPDLKRFEAAIKSIGATDNRAWSDIVTDYGFTSKDKLAKAKASRTIVGSNNIATEKPQKSIMDLSTEEYEAWKKQNITSDGNFVKK